MRTYFLASATTEATAVIEFHTAGGPAYVRHSERLLTHPRFERVNRATVALYLRRARERGWTIKRWR